VQALAGSAPGTTAEKVEWATDPAAFGSASQALVRISESVRGSSRC